VTLIRYSKFGSIFSSRACFDFGFGFGSDFEFVIKSVASLLMAFALGGWLVACFGFLNACQKIMWKVLLKYCGSTVNELTWNDDLALAIQQYCPNLESVYIYVHPGSYDTIQAFLSERKDSLKLIELTLHRGVPITILNVVKGMTNLTKFKIVRYIDDNGESRLALSKIYIT